MKAVEGFPPVGFLVNALVSPSESDEDSDDDDDPEHCSLV